MVNLRKLAKAYGLRQRELAEILKTDQSVVSLIVNGHRRLTEDQYEALVARFGADELAKYEGDDVVRQKVDLALYDAEMVKDVRQEVAEEVEIKETVIITPEIVNKEGIDIKKELKAGTLDAEVKPTQDVLPPHHAKVYTENDEMSPEVDANDPVFVRLLSSKHDFLNGRMYFVNLENGSVIRWVVRLDADNVRLISMKDEETVPMSAIKSISEVVAITKRPKTLPKERVTFDEAIARKDNQLDALLDQQSRLIDQQGRMIDLLEKKTN
jgi:transcriptional regulator with XRE-family HTH domain